MSKKPAEKRKKTRNNHIPAKVKRPCKRHVMILRQDLYNVASEKKVVPPATHIMTPRNFGGSTEAPPAVHSLPDNLACDDVRIVPSRYETTSSKPMPVADMPLYLYGTYPEIEASFTISAEHRRATEIETRGQATNVKWFEHRRGSITSTQFSNIRRFTKGAKISEDRLVKEVMRNKYKNMSRPTCPNKASLKWGISNERVAVAKYKEYMSRYHVGLEVLDSGLLVHRQKAYIRASPDGIVVCKCHPASPRLLEVKCPYTYRNDTWKALLADKKLPYITTQGPYVLLQNTPSFGYLDQVQGGLAITGLKECHFVIYTTKDTAILPVYYNKTYWETELLPSLRSFWVKSVAPAIATQHLQDMGWDLDSEEEEEEEEPDTNPPGDGSAEHKGAPDVIFLSPQPPTTGVIPKVDTKSDITGQGMSTTIPTSTQPQSPHVKPTLPIPISRIKREKPTPPVPTSRIKREKPTPPIPTSRIKREKPPAHCTGIQVQANTTSDATHCHGCGILLPEADYVELDNLNASVGCECRCGCTSWYCWPCARYTSEDAEDPWFCVPCVRNCGEVYLNV